MRAAEGLAQLYEYGDIVAGPASRKRARRGNVCLRSRVLAFQMFPIALGLNSRRSASRSGVICFSVERAQRINVLTASCTVYIFRTLVRIVEACCTLLRIRLGPRSGEKSIGTPG